MAAGEREWEKREKEMVSEYCRHPPDKRPNFSKLSIQSPFSAHWVELVGHWQGETESLLSPTPVGMVVGGACEPLAK